MKRALLAFIALSQIMAPVAAQVLVQPISSVIGSGNIDPDPPLPPGDHGRLNVSATMGPSDTSHMWIDVLKADFQPWIVGYMEPHPYVMGEYLFRPPVTDVYGYCESNCEGHDAAKALYDANGYLTELPDVYEAPNFTALNTYGFVDQEAGDTTFAGRYALIWDGTAEVEVNTNQVGAITNVVETANRIEFDVNNMAPANFAGFGILVWDVDPMDYLRNMHMYKLEYEDEFEAGQIVSPLWLENYGTVNTMRFMDLTKTNSPNTYAIWGSVIGHANSWATRAQEDDFSWGLRGIPIESVVKFGNETGINVWYTVPFFSQDTEWEYCGGEWCGGYVYPTGPITDMTEFGTNLAEYVEANLSEEVIFFVELGNEMWNWQFESAQRLEYERQNDMTWGGGTWMEYFSARYAVPLMDAFADVFSGQMHRIRRMGCVQGAYFDTWDWFFDAATWWTANEGGGIPPSAHFDASCWNAYFYPQSYWLYTEELITRIEDPMTSAEEDREWWAQLFYDHIDGTGDVAYIDSLTSQMLHADDFSNDRDLDVYSYEGGRHNNFGGGTSNDALVGAFMDEFNISEEMAEVYGHWITVWESSQPPDVYKHGFMQFNLITRGSSRFPFWAARWIGDSQPLIDLLLEYNAGTFP